MRKGFKFTSTLTVLALLLLNVAIASAATITGTQDDTPGVWLFSAGTDVPGGQPTDDIVGNAISAGILTLLGDQAGEIVAFSAGPPDTGEGPRDTTIDLVVQGLRAIDDFGLIEEPDDPSSNFDAGIGGWVKLGNFGEIRADGVVATGTIGPESGVDPEVALGGFEIFIFEDAELSGFNCTLHLKSGATITFTIADRQVNPPTEGGADDTLIAIDLDSIPGFNRATDRVVAITITDDGISQTGTTYGDTTLELDAVATRVSLLPGSISGYKWNDKDGDGVWDPDEAGLGGWTISIAGPVSASTTTAPDGSYTFTDLPAGTYTVSETLQAGWTRTYPPAPGTHTVNLAPGQSITGKNFGNRIPPGSISGYKWNDENGNGVQDPGEARLEGWKIILSGPVNTWTTTASDGSYTFTNLPPGTYTVSEEPKPGWHQTYPPGSVYTLTLGPGESSTGNRFGNRVNPPSVGGEGEILAPTSSHSPAPILAAMALGLVAYTLIRKRKSSHN
jgi:hypothetical protein